MNLIEALRQANGKPVSRKAISKGSTIQEVNGAIVWDDRPIGKVEHFRSDAFLADDWYVVEPKSKIEEAIERELGVVQYDINGPAHKIINRVVNLALDEAKKAAVGNNVFDDSDKERCVLAPNCVTSRIDALKVKE